MEVVDLPQDILVLVAHQLAPRDAIVCRRVSRKWHAAFTAPLLNLELLKSHYPRCFELRAIFENQNGNIPAVGGLAPGQGGMQKETIQNGTKKQTLSQLFGYVANRYSRLYSARPHSLEKILIGTFPEGRSWDRSKSSTLPSFHPVAPWKYFPFIVGTAITCNPKETSWCYGQKDGLLVFPIHPDDRLECDLDDSNNGNEVRRFFYPWRLLDLHTGKRIEVPFPHDHDRILRRVRLSDRVLTFEWCERVLPHHDNSSTALSPHFASVFDIVRGMSESAMSTCSTWSIVPRTEFRLYRNGLPLDDCNRYLTAHTRTHYAIYTWLPTREHMTDDGLPAEGVVVYDISSSSSPPRVVFSVRSDYLEFHGVRQYLHPRLTRIALDTHNLYFIEEKHCWSYGPQCISNPPRVHWARTTGIPVIPSGRLPKTTSRGGSDKLDNGSNQSSRARRVEGPSRVDQCGSDIGDTYLCCCARIASPPTTHSEHADNTISSPGTWSGSSSSSTIHGTTIARQLQNAMRVSAERWPGWAPCWRHEEFPYLTISEAVDFAAGVRFVARRCFLLEVLSAHAQPVLAVCGLDAQRDGPSSSPLPQVSLANIDEDRLSAHGGLSDSNIKRRDDRAQGWNSISEQRGSQRLLQGQTGSSSTSNANLSKHSVLRDPSLVNPNGTESVFDNALWIEMMGADFICGDERWLIGQDDQNHITIARF
ncbi:hypothetical protein BD289DRAFT_154708 [Coniella lustricola]|uniref:F-box domain-containing protein n=1 Tax=Coniella lustricola TaxID=2025994 RepID=A0A2T3AME4_9PEZI|nr:hypothetical protein BD289DRAFT_154708 [Coniella lustricola]